jgi:hypothetical protein
MLELTGFASVLRGISFLYWALAIGAIGLAVWKGKTAKSKAGWAAVAIVIFGFLPAKAVVEQAQRNAYAREAWAHFKKKCDTEAGEKIYKTFTGVRSVLVVKPLPPAAEKDLYDQFWYGDPYSNATPYDKRDISVADTLLRTMNLFGVDSIGFEFVEIQHKKDERYVVEEISPDLIDPLRNQFRILPAPRSKFAIGWEDISTQDDRMYWVAGSRLRIQDVTTGAVVAERIGFLIESGFGSTAGQRRPWLSSRGPKTTCPILRNGTFEDRLFILRVLKP